MSQFVQLMKINNYNQFALGYSNEHPLATSDVSIRKEAIFKVERLEAGWQEGDKENAMDTYCPPVNRVYFIDTPSGEERSMFVVWEYNKVMEAIELAYKG